MELNPNHAVTRALRDQWHKLAALAVQKAGGHVVITSDDLHAMGEDTVMTVQELDDGLHLNIMSRRDAELLVAQHGGLPS